jgi:tRNA1(Val) A37 N6-methylase TrmN6
MKNQADTLLGGRVFIFQSKNGARASVDSVLLAAALDSAIVGKDAEILEAGVGNGAAAMCVLSRIPDARLTGIDIDSGELNLARMSAAKNGFEGRFEAAHEDIFAQSAAFKKRLFDVVLTNPPYFHGKAPDDSARARARIADFDLYDWLKSSISRLKSSGTFAMIHEAGRGAETMAALVKLKMGRIELFPFTSHAGGDAKRVVVRAVKGSRTPSLLHAPIVMHEPDGGWSRAAKVILEGAESLDAVLALDMHGRPFYNCSYE